MRNEYIKALVQVDDEGRAAKLTQALGEGWITNSFQALIAHPGGTPQGLHQDQGASHPFQTPEAPLLFNSLFIMDDVDDRNGGT